MEEITVPITLEMLFDHDRMAAPLINKFYTLKIKYIYIDFSRSDKVVDY